jgi:hypothetical protein
MDITKEDIIIKRNILINVRDFLKINNRGRSCFSKEEAMISEIDVILENSKDHCSEMLFIIGDFVDDIAICKIDLIFRIEALLKEKQDEYNCSINDNIKYFNEHERILAEAKNRKDAIMDERDIFLKEMQRYTETHEDFNNFKTILNESQNVFLQMDFHTYLHSSNGGLAIKIPKEMVNFTEDTLTIGHLNEFSINEPKLYFEFNVNTVYSISKSFLAKGITITSYNNPTITIFCK